MNISLTVRFNKNWELGNGVLMFQKLAKTGNIWKKKNDYRLPSNSFVPLIQFFLCPNNWGLSW